MVIALAKEKDYVCEHFGHCEQFALYDTETGRWNYVDNPGHQPGILPPFLKGLGADVVVSGGMGARAQQLFAEQNIEVIVGVNTTLEQAVKQYLQGTLRSSGSTCEQHQHAGDCHA